MANLNKILYLLWAFLMGLSSGIVTTYDWGLESCLVKPAVVFLVFNFLTNIYFYCTSGLLKAIIYFLTYIPFYLVAFFLSYSATICMTTGGALVLLTGDYLYKINSRSILKFEILLLLLAGVIFDIIMYNFQIEYGEFIPGQFNILSKAEVVVWQTVVNTFIAYHIIKKWEQDKSPSSPSDQALS